MKKKKLMRFKICRNYFFEDYDLDKEVTPKKILRIFESRFLTIFRNFFKRLFKGVESIDVEF